LKAAVLYEYKKPLIVEEIEIEESPFSRVAGWVPQLASTR